MKHRILTWCFGLGGMIVMSGCGKPVSNSDLPGTYLADYGFATETVTIKSDGLFLQQVKIKSDNKVVATNGTWHFNQGDQDIVFSEEFMMAMDGFGRPVPNFDRPTRKAISILPVRRSFGRLQIGVDPDIPYKRQGSQ